MKKSLSKINKRFLIYNCFLILILLLGLYIRIQAARIQPIWLDEQLSIYYATQFGIKELLFNFSSAVHPGLFYLFVKLVLLYTNNLFFLRLILAIIPQIIGITILIYVIPRCFLNTKESAFFKLGLAAFLSFHPLLINLSWWLRMYGMIFLITSASFLFLNKLKENRNKLTLFYLVSLLFVGNMLHFSMYIFGFFCLWYLISSGLKSTSKKFKALIAVIVIFSTQFYCQNGYRVVNKLQQATWIASPTVANIPTFYLTLLGFQGDLHTQILSSSIVHIFFYSVLIVYVYLFYKRKVRLKINKQWLHLVAYPFIALFLLSFIIPFFSHRIFFYRFIPRMSLFLPRIHLPFLVVFYVLLANYIVKKKLYINKVFPLILVINLFLWIGVNKQTNFSPLKITSAQELSPAMDNQTHNNLEKIILWPSWMWYETIDLNQIEKISNIDNYFPKSLVFEKEIERIPRDHILNPTICNHLSANKFYIRSSVSNNLIQNQEKLIEILNSCCEKKKALETILIWQCN